MHMYLDNYNSFHPKSTKHSIVFSQCLRIKRICSDPIDFDKKISQLTGYFLSAGYPLPVIRRQINRAKKRSRSELLEYRVKTPSSRIPFVTSYHPAINRLIGIFKNDFEFLKEDITLTTPFNQPPLLAFRQPPNLKRLLTSSRLPVDRSPAVGNTGCK